ncbi:TetR/AcrR family transcriptional regulator [Sutcliffiella deserti]|uniref:TetR/AcrR family transcriptional regulator n=1 Tax=Sutcliffiella deserti TaxID=2875501 RepID=UPI001CC0FABA|nr:TetR/AcrR family transcriptional regulator [Sutcliffiella deserti]
MSPKVSKEHMELRKATILEAAKAVFIEHGYERTTMKLIMDAAKVSRGGLYQYFSNKEVVYETILQEALNRFSKETKDLLEGEVPSYWELLLLCMFGSEQQPDDKMDPMAPSNLEFFITGKHDPRRREYGAMRYNNGLTLYKKVIEQGQKSGEFSIDYDSEIIARTILTFTDGLALGHSILPQETIRLKEQSTLFVVYLKKVLNVSL